jgi:hypothetical protein
LKLVEDFLLPLFTFTIMDAPWTKTQEQILEHFGVDSNKGLSSAQVEKHAELYGKNGRLAMSTSYFISHITL